MATLMFEVDLNNKTVKSMEQVAAAVKATAATLTDADQELQAGEAGFICGLDESIIGKWSVKEDRFSLHGGTIFMDGQPAFDIETLKARDGKVTPDGRPTIKPWMESQLQERIVELLNKHGFDPKP